MASICSVTLIEPSSLAMPLALRPATSNDGQHRPQFADQRDGNDLSDLPLRPVRSERARHLQGHHDAAEEADQADDEQRADADRVHLQENVVGVVRERKMFRNARPLKYRKS